MSKFVTAAKLGPCAEKHGSCRDSGPPGARAVRRLLMLLFCLLLAGCGDVGSSSPSLEPGGSPPPKLAPVFRTLGKTVEKTIGSAGGDLQATADDGTRFVLTIPAGALNADTLLTMTPVAVSGQLGLPVQLPYAVKIGPSGTQFIGGADLAITLPAGVDPTAYFPYVMEDSGFPMGLTVATKTGGTLTFRLYHLTVPGVSNSPIPNPPSAGLPVGASALASQVGTLVAANASAANVFSLLETYFSTILQPLLQAAAQGGSDAQCRAALGEAVRFKQLYDILNDLYTSPPVNFDSSLKPLVASVIQRGLKVIGDDAVQQDKYQPLLGVSDYITQAETLGVHSSTYGLDDQTIKDGLPLKVELQVTEAPATIDDGQSVQIKVKAGFKLGGKPLHNAPPIQVHMALTGGSPSSADQETGPDGVATFDNVKLDENKSEIVASFTGAFGAIQVGSAGPVNSGSVTRTIPGTLKITAVAGATSNNVTPVTATVRKGRSNLANQSVSFAITSGGGTITPQATTNAQGQAMGNLTNGTITVVQASTTSGAQQATTNVTVSASNVKVYYAVGTITSVTHTGVVVTGIPHVGDGIDLAFAVDPQDVVQAIPSDITLSDGTNLASRLGAMGGILNYPSLGQSLATFGHSFLRQYGSAAPGAALPGFENASYGITTSGSLAYSAHVQTLPASIIDAFDFTVNVPVSLNNSPVTGNVTELRTKIDHNVTSEYYKTTCDYSVTWVRLR